MHFPMHISSTISSNSLSIVLAQSQTLMKISAVLYTKSQTLETLTNWQKGSSPYRKALK